MGLTTALYSSLSGMTASSQGINVTGHNIANVNTTSYKATRAAFETQFSRMIRNGTAPSEMIGGTNPSQVGQGVRIAGVARDFSAGALKPTGVNTDLAIEGSGFFILDFDGAVRYTRDGSFTLDRDFRLVNTDGGLLQGSAVDSEYNLVEGVLGEIVVPIGTLTLSEPTKNVNFRGNFDASGDVATMGARITSAPIFSDTLGSTPAVAGDNLATLFDAAGTQLFSTGDIILFAGAQKGGASLPDHTFEIGSTNASGSDANGTTLQSFLDFLVDVIGLDTSVSGGITVSAGGQIVVEGNSGTANDLLLESGDVIVNQTTNPMVPFTFTKQNAADGESVRTTFVAYDSLGTGMLMDMIGVLEAKTNAGTEWRFYLESEDDSDLGRVIGNGTVEFDTNGSYIAATNTTFIVDRANTGAFTPQQIKVEFNDPEGAVSALASTGSQVMAVRQDGAPIGTLADFNVTEDGTVIGVFSNSLSRTMGRIQLGQFVNPHGLEELGGNLYRETVSSGNGAVFNPGAGGTGRLIGGSLELSNVDLSQEFINLISLSTGFSANSRVLTTSDRLIEELLAVVR